MKKCYIIGAGEFSNFAIAPSQSDLIIAVDGGYAHLERNGVTPNLVIGDFDSSEVPNHPNIITLPREKDDTDMAVAVRHAVELGYTELHIYGGTGGRIDHTLANIQLLACLVENGCRGLLIGNESTITVIKNSSVRLLGTGTISVFAYSPVAKGVNLRGFKYPLCNATLTNTNPIGTSNEFTDSIGEISVADGSLMIISPNGSDFCETIPK